MITRAICGISGRHYRCDYMCAVDEPIQSAARQSRLIDTSFLDHPGKHSNRRHSVGVGWPRVIQELKVADGAQDATHQRHQ